MQDCYLKARAYVDWLELKEKVESESPDLPMLELYSKYQGFSYDREEMCFDCDYRSIAATVQHSLNGYTLTDGVAVFDDDGNNVGVFLINDLKKYVVED